ncbi:MAG: DUF4114 domain-containing protein [Planctomycetota bacterium]
MKRCVLACCAAAAPWPTAAGQTTINAPGLFERDQAEILADAFGGAFSQSGTDLIGDTIRAIRVDDESDQTWNAGTYDVAIIGRESLFNTKFGYATEDDSFERVLRTTSGPKCATITVEDDFAWAVKNHALLGGNVYTSENEANSDGRDHMVTYQLLDGDRAIGYALFFEDWGGHFSDNDFNDLAVIVSIVPAPTAALLGFTSLGVLGVRSNRRVR